MQRMPEFLRLHGDRCMWDSLLARDRVWNQRVGSITTPDVAFMISLCYSADAYCLWLVKTKTSCKERREKAGKAASEKLKEHVGEGGGDARPNPKPLHNRENSIAAHVEELRRQDKIGGEPKPSTGKAPVPVFIRNYESRLRMDVDTDSQDDQLEIAIKAVEEWEKARKAGATQPLKPPSQTPEYE
jgi:hypothetical protein